MTARKNFIADGDTITVNGLQFVVGIENDDTYRLPWQDCDGHGPVSEWTSRDKKPGEVVLINDRNTKRFYDAAEATRQAKRDGWGLGEDQCAELAAKLGRAPTRGEIRAEAVRRDFEYLRGWCNDEWRYVGVCVRHVSQDEDSQYSHALWGIESNSDEYLAEVAQELAEEICTELAEEKATLRQSLAELRSQARALIRDIRSSSALRPAICAAVRAQLAAMLAQRTETHNRIAQLSA